MRIKHQILLIFFLLIPLREIFSNQNDTNLEKFKIKQSQYFNQKKYEAVILIGKKLHQETGGRDRAIEEYLINAYQKQLEALIAAKQAKVLLENQQILQSLKLINNAETESPFTSSILKLKDKIYKIESGLNPLASLSEAQKAEFQKVLTQAQSALDYGQNEEALGLFAKAILIAPTSPEAIEGYNLALVRTNKENLGGRARELLVKADQLIKEKKYPEAVSTLDEVLSLDPINTYAINKKRELGELIKSMAQNAQKEELAKEYIKDANNLIEQSDFASAIEKYNLGKSLLPDYTNWDGLIKDAERKRKESEERKFARSLDDMGKSYQRGIYYLASEEFAKAITEFETVISISEKYGQKETIKQTTELLQKARDNFKRKEEEVVGKSNPYYKMINNTKILGLNAFNEKQFDVAKQYFSSILELFPKNRFARIYYLKSDIELNPGSKEAVIKQFVTEIEATMDKEPVEAKRLLTISLEIDPKNPELTELYNKLNRTRPQAIIKKSTVPIGTLNAWYQQAFLAMTQENDLKKANTLLTQIIQADPTYIKAITLKARIEGRTQAVQVRKPVPAEAQKYYSEGLWHYGQGRIQEAKSSFEQALKIDPGYQNARNAREKCIKYLQQTQGI